MTVRQCWFMLGAAAALGAWAAVRWLWNRTLRRRLGVEEGDP